MWNVLGYGPLDSARQPPVDDGPDPYPWLEGTRIYSSWAKVVVKCHTKDGMVAKKVASKDRTVRSEAYMGKYAREVAGMKVPAFRGLEDYGGHKVIVTDLVPGHPLDLVWNQMTSQNKASIKQALKEQISLMRRCTAKNICCVNRNGRPDLKMRIPDPYNPSRPTARLEPLADEAAFDAWKVGMAERRGPPPYADLVKQKIKKLPAKHTNRFVLTHGDLTPGNILVRLADQNAPAGPKNFYVISGIIDWQYSAFLPEYMEYTILKTNPAQEYWWRSFMCGLLEEMGLGCSNARLDFEKHATALR